MSGKTGDAGKPRKPKSDWPDVNTVSYSDILEVLAAGLDDFRKAPLFGLFFSGVYALGGWILILLLFWFDLPFLVYPLAAGFALIAPFIACGFYVISFHLEQETPLTWATVFSSVRGMVGRDLGWMALITGFALYIWVDIAAILYFTFMGLRKISFNELVAEVFSTQMGLILLFVGNITGAMIAFFVFSISVVSFPMLFHRDIDFVTAMVTSVRFVIRNPLPLAFWCFLIAFLIGVSILSGLVGLLVILPVLGHATWHLYRRAVAPAPTGGASSAS